MATANKMKRLEEKVVYWEKQVDACASKGLVQTGVDAQIFINASRELTKANKNLRKAKLEQ